MKAHISETFEIWSDGVNTVFKDKIDCIIRPRLIHEKLEEVDASECPVDVIKTLADFKHLKTIAELKGQRGMRYFNNKTYVRGKPGQTVGVRTENVEGGTSVTEVIRDDFSHEDERIWLPYGVSGMSELVFNLEINELYQTTDQYYIGALEKINDDNTVTLIRGGKPRTCFLTDIRPLTGKVRSVESGLLIDYVHGMRCSDIIGVRSIIFGDVVETRHESGKKTYHIHLEDDTTKLESNQRAENTGYLLNEDETVNYDIVHLSGALGYNLKTEMPCLFEGNWVAVDRRRMRQRYFNQPNSEGSDFDKALKMLRSLPAEMIPELFKALIMS